MIELRWVIRQIPAPQYGEDVTQGVSVLQYRTRKESTSEFGLIASWTNWQDVPTVKEEK